MDTSREREAWREGARFNPEYVRVCERLALLEGWAQWDIEYSRWEKQNQHDEQQDTSGG